MERTLLIVKPDAVARNVIGEIIRRLEAKHFRVAEKPFHNFTEKKATSL